MLSVETRNIVRREFKRIGERKTLYLLIIILPVIVSFLFAYIYKNEIIRDLPVAIYDEDHSSLSRTVTEFIESSTSMKIEGYVNSADELKRGIQSGIYQGGFYIPRNMENDIKQGKNSTVVIFKNTSSLIIGNLIMRDGMAIVKTVSAGAIIKKLRNKGMGYEQALNIANPIKVETQSLYNPNYSYLSYLVPGLLAVTLQLIIMISAVIVISSEFTHETFHELLEISKNNIYRIIFGKAMPHLLIHTASIILIVGIVFPIFNIGVNGSVLVLLLFFILFAAAALSLGLFISSAFHDQLFATELALVINTPAFIFSGFTFPIWAMPLVHRIFAGMLPFTYFVSGFLKISQMNTPVVNILSEILILLAFTISGFILTIVALKIHVNKYYKIKV